MRLRRILLPAFFGTALVIAVGCRYDWTYVEDEGGTSDGGNGTEGGASDGSSDKRPTETEASPPPPPIPSECNSSTKCPAGYYCEFSDGKCGKTDGAGKCQSTSITPCESQMACACNGGGAMDRCLAFKNGSDVDDTWATCGGVETFKCGSTPVTLCKRGLQACKSKASGVPIDCVDVGACADGCLCPNVKNATVGCTCDDKVEPGTIYIDCP